jgi:hypothetical protein
MLTVPWPKVRLHGEAAARVFAADADEATASEAATTSATIEPLIKLIALSSWFVGLTSRSAPSLGRWERAF